MRIVYTDWRRQRRQVEFAAWSEAMEWLYGRWWLFCLLSEFRDFVEEVEEI